MQQNGTQVALQSPRKAHSLAARRARFAAQVREMAVDDLKQVGDRLEALRQELQKKTGQPWRIQDVAEANGFAIRTYAAWHGGENENRSGEAYKKLAKFYTRRLGRKITWQWIVFGDAVDKPGKQPTPEEASQALSAPASSADLAALRGQLDRIEEQLGLLLGAQGLDSDAQQSEQESQQTPGSSETASGS